MTFCKHYIIANNIHSLNEGYFGCFPFLVIISKLLKYLCMSFWMDLAFFVKSGVYVFFVKPGPCNVSIV